MFIRQVSRLSFSNLAINSVNSAIAVDLVELRRIPEFLQKNKTKKKTLRAIVEKKKKKGPNGLFDIEKCRIDTLHYFALSDAISVISIFSIKEPLGIGEK